MATGCLESGALVRIDGIEHRLMRQVEDCWQLERSKTGRIAEYKQDDLLRMIADNRLTFPGNPIAAVSGSVDFALSPAELDMAKLRRSYVLAVLNMPNTRERLEDAIHNTWTRLRSPKVPPGYVSVYHWKVKFLKSKGDIRALAANIRSRGNRLARYPSAVIELCEQSISAKYLNRVRNSIQQTLEDALWRVKKKNELRPACDALPLPTRRLIARMIANISAFDKYSAR
jgi:putative transposase